MTRPVVFWFSCLLALLWVCAPATSAQDRRLEVKGSTQKQKKSTAVKGKYYRQIKKKGRGYQHRKDKYRLGKYRVVNYSDRLVPRGCRDGDDFSSAPYLLSKRDLHKFGLQRKYQGKVTFNPRNFARLKRYQPVYRVRILAIRTADSDGRRSAQITKEEVGYLVNQANRVFWRAGVEFLYDPKKDFIHRNSTLLNQDCNFISFGQNETNPNWDPHSSDGAKNGAERVRVAKRYPGRLVVFFRYGTRFDWDPDKKIWQHGPTTVGFSGTNSEFVAMTWRMPEKNLLAHEIGHYMHLAHPHGIKADTVIQAAAIIKDWVGKGNSTKGALKVFDGDRASVLDTPADTGGGGSIFADRYGSDAAACAKRPSVVYIPVRFPNGYQAQYTLAPDRLNVMSYYKHCHNLGTHRFSREQILRIRNALTKGNRAHLLLPNLKFRR